jgi:hypothetical protein
MAQRAKSFCGAFFKKRLLPSLTPALENFHEEQH